MISVFRRFVNRFLLFANYGQESDRWPWREDWSIGIYTGDSPFVLAPSLTANNPVLNRTHVSDVPAAFVADPFMVHSNGLWQMFFEVMNRKSRKGEIGLATSDNGFTWTYRHIVLSEPYHLSYPYVFEWMGQFYMIPEGYMAGGVRLYKAIEFPVKWSFAGTLLSGLYYVDASILRYDDKWWIFVDASVDMQHNTLKLFWSEDLFGVWREHPSSPLVAGNPHIARPAGRVLVLDNGPIRFTQDCASDYGTKVRAFEICELTLTAYKERPIDPQCILGPSGRSWNACGMHHLDAHPVASREWIACVDGWRYKDSTDERKQQQIL